MTLIENTLSILSSIEFWKIAAPASFGIFAWLFNERSKREWERWQLKKSACLNALNIANAVISNFGYENVKSGDIKAQYATIETVRACHNDLAIICDSPDVLNQLKHIMFGKGTPAEIVSLRAAVRKELGMGKQIDLDTDKAFIGKINCEEPKTELSVGTQITV